MDPTTKAGREAISLKLQGQEAAAKMGHSKRPDAWQAAALLHIEKLETERAAARECIDVMRETENVLRAQRDELWTEVVRLQRVVAYQHTRLPTED